MLCEANRFPISQVAYSRSWSKWWHISRKFRASCHLLTFGFKIIISHEIFPNVVHASEVHKGHGAGVGCKGDVQPTAGSPQGLRGRWRTIQDFKILIGAVKAGETNTMNASWSTHRKVGRHFVSPALFYRGKNTQNFSVTYVQYDPSILYFSFENCCMKAMGFLADRTERILALVDPCWGMETAVTTELYSLRPIDNQSFHYVMFERKSLKWGIWEFGCSWGW